MPCNWRQTRLDFIPCQIHGARVEFDPHEERLLHLVGVLLGVDDVAAVRGEVLLEGGLADVVGAHRVDLHHGAEGVVGEHGGGREEVAGGAVHFRLDQTSKLGARNQHAAGV